jgi:hypothetical protein
MIGRRIGVTVMGMEAPCNGTVRYVVGKKYDLEMLHLGFTLYYISWEKDDREMVSP